MAKADLSKLTPRELVAYLEFKKYSESGVREVLSELFKRKTGKPYPTALGIKAELAQELLAPLVPYGLSAAFALKKVENRSLFGDLVEGFVNLGKSVVKVGAVIYEGVSFVVLAPFKGAMKKALKSKGVPYKDSMKDIATKFVDHVIKKNPAYEHSLASFQSYEALQNVREVEDLGNLADNYEKVDNLAPMAVAAIITAVISFFDNLKKKKESGVPMSETEETMYKMSQEAAKNADELIRQEQQKAVGGFVLDNKTLIIILAVVLAGFFLLRR